MTERKPVLLFSRERPLSPGDLRDEKEPARQRSTWRRSIPGREDNTRKDSAVGRQLASQGQKEGPGGRGIEGKDGGRERDNSRELGEASSCRGKSLSD